MPEAACRLASLPSLGAISVTGADAADFLAAQLSQAPPSAGAERAPLAAWHDAKGRVQALFRFICRDDGYLLITHDSVVDDVATSLRRYILRAEVTIDVPADFAGVAFVGDSTPWLAEHGAGLATELWATATKDDVTWLRLGPELVHAVSTADRLDRLAQALPSGSPAEAELAEIRLGIPAISAELRGQFLPQMLNLDILGGVAFDKGCYPGQEVIARVQNLGTIKRRMLRYEIQTAEKPPTAGLTLRSESNQAAGVVVRSAPSDVGIELLAVVALEAAGSLLICEEIPDAGLASRPLPYAIPGAD